MSILCYEGLYGLRVLAYQHNTHIVWDLELLKPRLGHSWTNAWQAAGFTNGSLAVPANPMTMLQQFRAYFLLNPTHEKPDLAVGIHAPAAATELAAQLISTASTASNQSNTAAGIEKSNLENAITAGRTRLSGLREELSQLMGDEDDRWYAFGFEKPSDPETPEVPENLTGVGGGVGALFVDFDDARRADNYRISIFNHVSGAKLTEKMMDDRTIARRCSPVGPPAWSCASKSPHGPPAAWTASP